MQIRIRQYIVFVFRFDIQLIVQIQNRPMQIPQCHPIRTDAQRLPVVLFHQLVHISTMGQLFQSSFDLANLTNRIFTLFEVPGQFRIDPSQISTKRIFIP